MLSKIEDGVTVETRIRERGDYEQVIVNVSKSKMHATERFTNQGETN